MRLMLDPGHTGQSDPGAVAGGVREADITLDVALRVANLLQGAPGIEVRLTRTANRDLTTPYTQKADLQARCDRANAWPADLFVSVHCNAASNPDAYGLETYVHTYAPAATEEVARSLHATLAPLARADRGLKRANFHVLRETRMPAVLVELGFLTNAEDRRLLTDPTWQARVADAIAGWVRQRWGSPAAAPAGAPILGAPQATVEQAKEWARSRQAHDRFIAVLPLYWQEAPRYGIRPEVAAAQAAKETAFGRYTGVVPPEYHNWCGLKTRAGGPNDDPNAHARFPNDLTGVRAHLQHLARYAGATLPPGEAVVDPRYELVTPGAAPTVEALGGRWAPSPDYGVSIVRDYLAPLLATQAPAPAPPAPQPKPVAILDPSGRRLCEGWLDGDRTVVPLRDLAEAMGLMVDWDPGGPSVTLRWPGGRAP